MLYETVYKDYLDFLPEKADEIKSRMVSEDIEPDEGMHTIFGEVIVPLILEWVEMGDSAANKALAFVEEMASCEDRLVGELLDFTILESIVDQDSQTYVAIRRLLGPKTLDRCEAIEEYITQA